MSEEISQKFEDVKEKQEYSDGSDTEAGEIHSPQDEFEEAEDNCQRQAKKRFKIGPGDKYRNRSVSPSPSRSMSPDRKVIPPHQNGMYKKKFYSKKKFRNNQFHNQRGSYRNKFSNHTRNNNYHTRNNNYHSSYNSPRHRNFDQAQNKTTWENFWPPAEMFRLVDEEIKKYTARTDKTSLYNLFSRISDFDEQFKNIETSEDMKTQFGNEDAARLMVFYIATNGTLRSRLNDLKKKLCYNQKRCHNDII